MTDQMRTVVGFLLIIAILVFWTLLSKPRRKQQATPTEKSDTVQVVEEPEIEEVPPTIPVGGDTILIEKDRYRLVLSSVGGSVKEFYLRRYDVNIVPDDGQLFVTRLRNKEIFDFKYQVNEDSVVFTYNYEDGNLRKIYYFDHPEGFRLKIDVSEKTDQILSLKSGLSITEHENKGEDLRHFNVYISNKKFSSIKKMIKDEFSYTEDVEWFALRSKYFLLVIENSAAIKGIDFYKLPKDQVSKKADIINGANQEVVTAAFGCFYMRGGGDRYGAEMIASEKIDISVLLLPVKYAELTKYNRGYEQVSSGGLLGPIIRIILVIFNFFYSIIGNYGFAIILFAIMIKAIFFPLSRKMIESQRKMQMIQPELKKLQKKYKDEPQRLNQEMMHLYKTYKVNPFGGCLPLLIQMPIFIALYQTLITSIEFRQASFIFWITDLSMKDPYYVLPISMGVMMLIQSLITTIDPRQKFMVIIMPIFMVYIFLNFPSGLQLYWFSYNILTLVEHIITKRGGMK